MELPRYRCYKEVQAFKIFSIATHDDENELASEGKRQIAIVTRAYLNKHDPCPGGYYVRYNDGYESFSPAAAFESGYTPIE